MPPPLLTCSHQSQILDYLRALRDAEARTNSRAEAHTPEAEAHTPEAEARTRSPGRGVGGEEPRPQVAGASARAAPPSSAATSLLRGEESRRDPGGGGTGGDAGVGRQEGEGTGERGWEDAGSGEDKVGDREADDVDEDEEGVMEEKVEGSEGTMIVRRWELMLCVGVRACMHACICVCMCVCVCVCVCVCYHA